MGRRALAAFLEAHGTGDQGAALTLPDGQEVHRLDGLHRRRYVRWRPSSVACGGWPRTGVC